MSSFKDQTMFRFRSLVSPLLWSLTVFLTVAGSKFALIAHFGINVPFWDQWGGGAEATYLPWLEGNFGWQELFQPHNEHRIVPTRILSLLLLETNGLWDPLLQMVTNAMVHACAAVVLFLCLHRVCERAQSLIAIGVATLFSIPLNWENTLWGFQSQLYFLVLFSVLSLWIFTAAPWGTLKWWGGWLFLMAACFSMGSGFFVAIAVGAVAGLQVALQPEKFTSQRFLFAVAALGTLVVFWLAVMAPHGTGATLQPLGSAIRNSLGLLSWPLSNHPWAFILVQAPAIATVMLLIKRRSKMEGPLASALGLVVWTFLQAGAIGLTRGMGGSRYWDLFAVGLASNLALLTWLIAQFDTSRTRRLLPWFATLWCLGIAGAAGWDFLNYQRPTFSQLNHVRTEQADRLRRYLLSNDPAVLQSDDQLSMPLYPDLEKLQAMLQTPALRQILPAEFQPTRPIFGTTRDGVFAESNLPQELVPPPLLPSWGSYDPVNKEEAKGAFQLTFEASPRTRWIEFFVAGQPSPHGSSLVFSSLDGSHRIPISFARSPGLAWESLIVEVPEGKIRLEACDKFDQRWFAFTAPRPVGRWEMMKRRVLQHGGWHWLIAGVGLMSLLGLHACFGRLLPQASGPIQE